MLLKQVDLDRQKRKSLIWESVSKEAVFKDKTRHAIRSISPLKAKVRDGIEHTSLKNLNKRQKGV